MSDSEPDALGQLAEEFLARFRLGERPAPTEYADRHPEMAQQILELFPALVTMEDVRPVQPTGADAGAVRPDVAAPWRLGEYRIVREIGRGGMGVVYEAEQESLSRRVALKVLAPGSLGDATQVERFQREARAAARLHHTNIVPVFAVGEESGTHYYVMQYIEGRPLDEVLEELRRLRGNAEQGAGEPTERASSASESPPGDGVASRSPETGSSNATPAAGSSSLLSDPQRPFTKSVAHLGIQVADALEYAAGQGVLHRDVKPSNLLLDVWGAVWLTDFGLAKATGTADLTRTGDLFGTLRYLAPERFSGRADARSDVYALGLTLYEILALRPAFAGHDQAELARQIATDEPPRLDRLNPQLPRDLVTVVHKAMAKDPADRYQTAGALAEDLRRFLDDRSIAARRPSLPELAWRWCRRNPSTAALVAAVLALAVMAAGGGLWLARQQAERQGRAREAVEEALAQVPGLRRQGRWPEATAVLAQGRSRLDETNSDDLRRRLERAEADIELAAKLEQIRLTPAIEGGRINYQAMAGAYSGAFEHAGLDIGGDEEHAAAQIHDSDLRPQLVMALDHWALVADELGDSELRARLLRLARLADPDAEWGDRVRDPDVWMDRERLRRLAEKAQDQFSQGASGAEPPTPLVVLLAMKLGKQEGDAEPLLRAAQRKHPEEFWLNYALGEVLRDRKPAEAVSYYLAALASRPSVGVVHFQVASALQRQGQVDEAISVYRRAIELEPQAAHYHHDFGMCLQDKGRLDEAMAEYRRAGQLSPQAPEPHNGLGLCLQSMGEFDKAMAEYRHALALGPRFGLAHVNLGSCMQAKGQLDEALAEYRRALHVDPNLAMAHYNIGVILRTQGRDEEAIAAFGRAAQLYPAGAAGNEALADGLLRRGHIAEARTAAQRGLDLLPPNEPRRQALQQILEKAERMLALDARLPALLLAKQRPSDAAEQLDGARLCRDCGRPYAAARLYAAAFAARPELADDPGNRYDAAGAAARAAAESGSGEARLGEPERAGLRRQALDWLRADLGQRAKLLQDGKAVGWALLFWQTDPALAAVRDRAPLEKLPDDERQEWQRLWADVTLLLAEDPLEQGRVRAARREWQQAADCYARALKRGPTDEGHFWFEYAALLLLCGDRPGYNAVCARMVDRCGRAPELRAYHVARACTLAPDAVADAERPGRLAKKELADHAGDFWSLTEQGALHYRAGRFKAAVPLLEKSLRADPRSGRAVLNWMWLAMACNRLGKAEEARRWQGKAQAWFDRYGDRMPSRAEEEIGLHLHNWLEAHVLRREVDLLLGAGPSAKK
jgi:serine/threonine protein kinase/Tfp pilus assembly protein PilF